MSNANHSHKHRALIIGGSLGGLFAGTLLHQIGWEVDIFERSAHDLDSRGGGIVLQPEVVEVFRRAGVNIGAIELGVRSEYRTVLRRDGSIQSKHLAPQTQTSWSVIYTTLKSAFGELNYHQAKKLVRIDQASEPDTVTAHFDDGTREVGNLLIGADGGNSVVRQQFWPSALPTYAGYLAWRGLCPRLRCRQRRKQRFMGTSDSPTPRALTFLAILFQASIMMSAPETGFTTGSGTMW